MTLTITRGVLASMAFFTRLSGGALAKRSKGRLLRAAPSIETRPRSPQKRHPIPSERSTSRLPDTTSTQRQRGFCGTLALPAEGPRMAKPWEADAGGSCQSPQRSAIADGCKRLMDLPSGPKDARPPRELAGRRSRSAQSAGSRPRSSRRRRPYGALLSRVPHHTLFKAKHR